MKGLRDRIKSLRRVKASELRASPHNWRRHPESQARAMRGLLEEIGFAGACLARETKAGLELIDGHLRRDLAEDEKIPVLVLDLTAAEARKLLATYDPVGGMAETDGERLAALLGKIKTGSEGVQRLLDELATRSGGHQDIAEEPGAQVDRATELQKQWGTELGQLWEIPGKAGVHRVLCGDSTKEADVGRVTGGQKPFIMVTDPPYGVGYEPGWRDGIVGEFGAAARVKDAVANDDTVDWSSAYRLFPGDVAYTWSPGGDHVLETGRAIQEAGFQIRSMLVWRKQHFAISRGHYHWQHEPCWYAVRKGKAARWCGDRTQSSIWDIASLNPAGRQEERLQHGTQKPLECMARPIRNHGAEGDVVYDPFLGSGTTIVACEQLGRIGYGIEIEPKYVAVTLQRLKDVGLQPRLSKTKTRKATKKTARKRS